MNKALSLTAGLARGGGMITDVSWIGELDTG
jgi:hypothetical protein